MEEYHNVEFTHGESGYLPLLLETGVVGLALMLVGIGISFYWCWQGLRSPAGMQDPSQHHSEASRLVSCLGAILPSVLASIVHSVADFVWYIPACMLMTVAQLACACRAYQLLRQLEVTSRGRVAPQHDSRNNPSDVAERSATSRRSATATDTDRSPWGTWHLSGAACLACTAVLALVGWFMTSNRLRAALTRADWDAYLQQSIPRSSEPDGPAQARERLDAMQRNLVRILQRNPRDAEAQLRLAAVYLKQFESAQKFNENAMDLSQIRDAAIASAFPSRQAQDAWLQVAVGEKQRELLDLAQLHSRLAVTLSPLQGLGYLHLAELSFLESPRSDRKSAYLDQAVRVRPYQGQVLYVRGKEAALAGDEKLAIQFYKQAFQQDPEIRQILIDGVADQMPADVFVEIFAPEAPVLGQLFNRYQKNGRLDEAKWTASLYVAALVETAPKKSAAEAALSWQRAQETLVWLGDPEQALRCQQRVVGLVPYDFDQRRTLARLLAQQQHYEDALQQLEWCLRRQPDNEGVRGELADVKIQMTQKVGVVPAAAETPERSRF
jgi:hypothetical protein